MRYNCVQRETNRIVKPKTVCVCVSVCVCVRSVRLTSQGVRTESPSSNPGPHAGITLLARVLAPSRPKPNQ